MTESESKALKVNDEVVVDGLPPGKVYYGVVDSVGRYVVKILWYEGTVGNISHGDMKTIFKVTRTVPSN